MASGSSGMGMRSKSAKLDPISLRGSTSRCLSKCSRLGRDGPEEEATPPPEVSPSVDDVAVADETRSVNWETKCDCRRRRSNERCWSGLPCSSFWV